MNRHMTSRNGDRADRAAATQTSQTMPAQRRAVPGTSQNARRGNDAPDDDQTSPGGNASTTQSGAPETGRDENRYRRAHIGVATLNMNGKHTMRNGVKQSKWKDIHSMVKTSRYGILALQETHLEEEDMETIDRLYGRRLRVVASSDPERVTQSAGVAFVLNKDLIKTSNVKTTAIIPGRALLIEVEWREAHTLTILNIYAPNAKREQIEFWNRLKAFWSGNRRKPDIMTGDFNAVEEEMDRAPARQDDEQVVIAMQEARRAMGLVDAWRHRFPTNRRFTFHSSRNTMSRLDRVYAKLAIHNNMFGWETLEAPVPTDHRIVSFKFAPDDAPEMGRGRWTWPRALLNSEALNRAVTKRARRMRDEIDEWQAKGRPRSINPQTILQAFKKDIKEEAKKMASIDLNKIRQKIRSLEKEIGVREDDPEIDESEDIREEIADMRSEHDYLNDKLRSDKDSRDKLNWELKGEVMGKYWSAVNAKHEPRDTILRLRRQGVDQPTYATTSKDMANVMRDQYDGIQRPPDDTRWTDEEREDCTAETLGSIPRERKLSPEEAKELDSPIAPDQVADALMSMPGGKATGLDGIPYEVWRCLHEEWAASDGKEDNPEAVNITRLLATAFNDVQKNGVDERTAFNMGWICPLYKKNEKSEAANYRPITLLNSDLKIMTKTISLRIAHAAAGVIHNDQAAFIKGRSIFDHVRLSRAMISYCEAYEHEGAIVALDQEKAYDRVQHEYLWRTLKTYGFPDSLITMIKNLYKGAKSLVIVNGVMSEPFEVTRGVRQGDPLSCILFNLAIEPLACMLRSDANLKGHQIKGRRDKLIVNLFADDTLIYLGPGDKMGDLQTTLDKWCAASGAKFNEEKTEVIPLGSPAQRKSYHGKTAKRRGHQYERGHKNTVTKRPTLHGVSRVTHYSARHQFKLRLKRVTTLHTPQQGHSKYVYKE
jgi:exonuclease III